MTHEYLFDLTLLCALQINAESEEEARAQLATLLDCASANFGAYPNGDPIIAEVSLDTEGECDLVEIDGEPT